MYIYILYSSYAEITNNHLQIFLNYLEVFTGFVEHFMIISTWVNKSSKIAADNNCRQSHNS